MMSVHEVWNYAAFLLLRGCPVEPTLCQVSLSLLQLKLTQFAIGDRKSAAHSQTFWNYCILFYHITSVLKSMCCFFRQNPFQRVPYRHPSNPILVWGGSHIHN
jgi:hypothetical protein